MSKTDFNAPHAMDSERAIIACVLVKGREAVKQIAHLITRDDFYDKRHVVIWRAADALLKRDGDIDLVTLTDLLRKKGYIDDIGGSAYLVEISNEYLGMNTLVSHAKLVADRAVARRIIKASSEIIKNAAEASDMEEFIESSEAALKGITRTSARSQAKLTVVDLEEWRQIARDHAPETGQIRGLSMGYQSLDDLTEGFEPGEVMIVTGHTKHGKSKLAANLAWNVAQQGKNVMFINTEMTKLQVARRMNGMARTETATVGKIYINDRADLAYQDAISIMENAKELGCEMVIVDHLHFFGRSVDNQVNEISKITKEFKEAAVQLDIPLMLLCHVQQGDTSKRPTLQSLKGSSSIAQDADMVITVWRDDRTNSPDPHTTEVIRLAARSAERAVTKIFLYADGIRLLEDKPPTTEQQKTFADDVSRIIGDKDDDDEDDLSPGWS